MEPLSVQYILSEFLGLFFYRPQRMEEVSKCLAGIKNVLYGSGDQEPQVDNVTKLALEIYETDTIFFMVSNLKKVDFEVLNLWSFIENGVLLCRWIAKLAVTFSFPFSKYGIAVDHRAVYI